MGYFAQQEVVVLGVATILLATAGAIYILLPARRRANAPAPSDSEYRRTLSRELGVIELGSIVPVGVILAIVLIIAPPIPDSGSGVWVGFSYGLGTSVLLSVLARLGSTAAESASGPMLSEAELNVAPRRRLAAGWAVTAISVGLALLGFLLLFVSASSPIAALLGYLGGASVAAGPTVALRSRARPGMRGEPTPVSPGIARGADEGTAARGASDSGGRAGADVQTYSGALYLGIVAGVCAPVAMAFFTDQLRTALFGALFFPVVEFAAVAGSGLVAALIVAWEPGYPKRAKGHLSQIEFFVLAGGLLFLADAWFFGGGNGALLAMLSGLGVAAGVWLLTLGRYEASRTDALSAPGTGTGRKAEGEGRLRRISPTRFWALPVVVAAGLILAFLSMAWRGQWGAVGLVPALGFYGMGLASVAIIGAAVGRLPQTIPGLRVDISDPDPVAQDPPRKPVAHLPVRSAKSQGGMAAPTWLILVGLLTAALILVALEPTLAASENGISVPLYLSEIGPLKPLLIAGGVAGAVVLWLSQVVSRRCEVRSTSTVPGAAPDTNPTRTATPLFRGWSSRLAERAGFTMLVVGGPALVAFALGPVALTGLMLGGVLAAAPLLALERQVARGHGPIRASTGADEAPSAQHPNGSSPLSRVNDQIRGAAELTPALAALSVCVWGTLIGTGFFLHSIIGHP